MMRFAPFAAALLAMLPLSAAVAQTPPAAAPPPPAGVPNPPPSAPSSTKPILGGGFKDWFIYSVGAGADRMCYALTKPSAMQPKGAKRDQPYFMVATWPSKNIVNQPSVLPGYPYKDDSKVQVRIGSDKFAMFTKNDGESGGAWIDDGAEELRLVAAMKKGSQMILTGISQKGTMTTDTYSLSGITAALDKVAEVCK